MTDLTARQREIVKFWRKFQKEHHGVAPTVREVGIAFGVTPTNGLQREVKTLIAKGALIRVEGLPENASRGIVAS